MKVRIQGFDGEIQEVGILATDAERPPKLGEAGAVEIGFLLARCCGE